MRYINGNDSNIADIYNMPYLDTPSERAELLNHKGGVTRLRTVKHGDMLDAEIFPLWDTTAISSATATRSKRSSEDERKYYETKQRKYLEQVINSNFVQGDLWCKLGYRDGCLPASIEDADVNMIRFIRKLARYCKKHNKAKLKYIFVTEETLKNGETVRLHHHLIINFRDRDIIEDMWTYEDRANTKRMDPDINGLGGMANYVLKAIKGRKSYHYSLGLTKPTIYTADSKITARTANSMASSSAFCESKLQKLYPGYALISIDVRRSELLTGAYMYARFRKLGVQLTAQFEDKPTLLTKEQVKRIKGKFDKIIAIAKELQSLERELLKAKTTRQITLKMAIARLGKSRQKLLTHFDTCTKKLLASDRALLRDRYMNGLELTALARQYHYSDKTAVYRKINKIIANMKV